MNKNCRGVSERFKVQSWKGCVGAIPPWVRIPSPLNLSSVLQCSTELRFLDDGCRFNIMVKHIKSLSIIVIITFAFTIFAVNAISKEQVASIEISDFAEIQNYYSYSPDYNDIIVMNNNKICFTTQGRLYIYDLVQHSLVDNILLSEDSDNIHFTNWIKLLSNENILIMQNKEIQGKPRNYKGSKTLIKIYSPKDKSIVFEKKIPRMSNWNYATAELSENKLIFWGSIYENLKESLILDIKNNRIERGSDLNTERVSAYVIPLNNEKFFIFGGVANENYPDNFAEVYNSKNDTYTKIPMNFNAAPGINNTRLLKLSDGRILILCSRAYETPHKTGKQEGFLHPDKGWVEFYPETYLTIFNPKDNLFEEIDINKGQKVFRNEYDALVLNNDRILITGGYNISANRSKPATDILIYDIKTNTLSKASQNFKYTHLGSNMSYLLKDGSVLVSGANLHFPILDNKVEKIIFKSF